MKNQPGGTVRSSVSTRKGAEVAMEEKQETPKSDQEELDFDRDALDRWQDDGGQ